MEFIENFFGKVWITKSQKIQRKATTVYLKQIKEYLATIACYISTNNVEGIVASKNYAGFVDQHLYLPTWIGCTESRDINKKAYLYLSLISCAAKQLNLKSNVLNESKIARRMECVKYYSVINKQLDKIFPHFQAFQQNFISDIKNNLKVSSNSAEYAHWQCAVLSRETQGPSITNHYLASLKSKDTVPDFLIVTTVDLPQETFSYVSSNAEVPSNTSTKDMTEQEKLENSPTKRIDLEKEKKDSNPVTHAFEKLNTADD
ncbi:MAG: hypothetical protein KDD37_09670 [Bdellovibrionales bacterium]|nr:hypothetical protein [Bdellovibrionales bacterium]